MISVLEKLDITIIYFKLIKTIYNKAIVNIVLNMNNLKDFFPNIWRMTRVINPLFFNIVLKTSKTR